MDEFMKLQLRGQFTGSQEDPLGEFSKSFTKIDCVGIKRIRVIRPKLDP